MSAILTPKHILKESLHNTYSLIHIKSNKYTRYAKAYSKITHNITLRKRYERLILLVLEDLDRLTKTANEIEYLLK